MRKFLAWVGSWIETLRIAPPFSKRRRELLETLRELDQRGWQLEHDLRDKTWVEVVRPVDGRHK